MRLPLLTAALPLVALAVAAATPADAARQRPARAAAAKPVAINPALAAAVADPRRDADRARDRWRKPAETLAFFQVAPDMKVGEYAPGGEWYSRLLGLYLGPKGKLVGLYFNPVSGAFPEEEAQAGIRAGAARYPADVAAASGVPADRFSAMTLERVPDSEKGTFDRILVTAGAPSVPKPLLDQLAPRGRLLVPEGDKRRQRLVLYERIAGRVRRLEGEEVAFVPLVGRHGWQQEEKERK